MSNMSIPQSTQALIMREREKMMNGVVRLVGRVSEELIESMSGANQHDSESSAIDISPRDSSQESIETVVERVLDGKLKSLLHDVDYRIKTLYDAADRLTGNNDRVGSKDLNLAHHILDGFVFTDNSPVAGSVAWSGCHVVYKGIDYTITNGDTGLKYIWWDFDAVPNTVFQASNTKPALTSDDVLIAINDGGTARLISVPGKMVPGGALLDGTVGASELGNGAVNSDKLAALAVIESKIASSAITSDKLGSGAVTNVKLGDGAVTSTKLGDSAVTNIKLGDGAVNSTKLASGAVTAGKIAAGGISTSSQFASGVVDNTALGAGAVTTAKIGDMQVTGPKIGAGEVATSKLNLASHLLY